MADMDNDGDLDVVCGALVDGLKWWENVHGFFLPHEIEPDYHACSALVVVDMNQDGTLDIVAGSYQPGDNVRVYYNFGDSWTGETLLEETVLAVDVGDADSDGDLDILTGYYELQLHIKEANGYTTYVLDTSGWVYRDADFADINQDGHPDMLVADAGTEDGPDFGGISWWEYSGDDFEEHVIRTELFNSGNAKAADMDNDGNIDVVGGAIGYQYCWFQEATNWHQVQLPDAEGMGNAIDLADVDGDGTIDVVESSYSHTIAWWKNTGSFTRYIVSTDFHQIEWIATGDLEQDGDIDIIAPSRDVDRIDIWKQVGGDPQYSLTLTPVNTQVPSTGGIIEFDAEIYCIQPVEAGAWTMVLAPNGQLYGPLINLQVSFPAGTSNRTGLRQQVPGFAPAGTYWLGGYIGYYSYGAVLMSGEFLFVKQGPEPAETRPTIEFPPGEVSRSRR